MKKVLIVIPDMEIGGAQKSLLAFLQCIVSSEQGKKYDIHLMVIKPFGAFYAQIPEQIHIIMPPQELCWLGMHFDRKLFMEHFTWRSVWGEGCWLLRNKLRLFSRGLNIQQRLWECWRKLIPVHTEHYDVAISYMDGVPNYYVMDKICADKKVLWVHSEYQKQGYMPEYDKHFFEASNVIVTISDNCQKCIVQEFPQCAKKVHVLENITSFRSVITRSNAHACKEYENIMDMKLLSVGRLHQQKGFDMAIGAAKMLRDAGVRFLWLVVGDGPERQRLQEMIDANKITDCFQLVGARDNPYVYMKACDILIQPSRVEGKSIVIDEAKILCKPIVVTNYTTVRDSVEHGKSGWIVDMTEEALFEGIMRMQQDAALRDRICENLKGLPKGNEDELKQYVKVMLQ